MVMVATLTLDSDTGGLLNTIADTGGLLNTIANTEA